MFHIFIRLKSAAFACGGALLGYYLYNNDNHHISNYFPALQSCFAEAKVCAAAIM